MAKPGEQYRTIEAIPVIVWWEIDTVAILEDYSECCDGELSAGELFTVRQVAVTDGATRIACELARERELLDSLIPRKRQNHLLLKRLPTPYYVEIRATDLEESCEPVRQSSSA